MLFDGYCNYRNRSIWAETTDKWDESHISWKIIGQSPNRISRFQCLENSAFNRDTLDKSTDEISSFVRRMLRSDKFYYLAVFSSGRTCTISSYDSYQIGTYAIIEADRGEDCIFIKDKTIASEETQIKKILRLATYKDIEVLESKKAQESKALEKCTSLAKERGLDMKITGCEFQWDMKKITFFFTCDRRVDFRELVKELFKYYKIRIWLSMENKKQTRIIQ